ncbi:MAG: DUF4998 domain-containing protein [Tannerella sp.]|jgi:hypothetical protein|nr:DUF4998 domain-containing protein [Tannerella sp.]
MSKIKFYNILIITFLYGFLTFSCGDMNDTQSEFLDRAGKVYPGKLASLVVHGGENRVQLTGSLQYAYTAESCMIRWEADSMRVSLQGYSEDDTLKVNIPNLSEGLHEFSVQTYDKEGNKSLNEVCYGTAYGEVFKHSASAKFITQMTMPDPTGIVLSWSESEDAESVEIEYESVTGMKTMLLPGNVATTKLPEWKVGGTIKSRTGVIPEAGAIDTLQTEWLVQPFPTSVEYPLDKSKIIALKLANDATPDFGGSADNIFNGIFTDRQGANFTSGYGIPNHLTFDLGVLTHLTRLELYLCDTDDIWDPRTIQFWGIANFTGAEITLPSMDAGWEAEAVAKGWTKLLDTATPADFNILTFDNETTIRYLIVRVTRVVNGVGTGVVCKLVEITLYADEITDLE